MSAFEADRFNHSRTSPEGSCQLPVKATPTSWHSTTAFKERLQQFRAAASQDATVNFHTMI
jgi:hypothetical protein